MRQQRGISPDVVHCSDNNASPLPPPPIVASSTARPPRDVIATASSPQHCHHHHRRHLLLANAQHCLTWQPPCPPQPRALSHPPKQHADCNFALTWQRRTAATLTTNNATAQPPPPASLNATNAPLPPRQHRCRWQRRTASCYLSKGFSQMMHRSGKGGGGGEGDLRINKSNGGAIIESAYVGIRTNNGWPIWRQ